MQTIPVIDISLLQEHSDSALRKIGPELHDAARDHGFFYIKGHGVPDRIVDSTFSVAQQFFALPKETKTEVKVSGPHRGFLPIGESTMEGYSGADQKESFIWGLDIGVNDATVNGVQSLLAPNRWHESIPEMKNALNAYFESAHEVTLNILRALAVSLGKNSHFFASHFNRPTSRGSLIYYPATKHSSSEYGVSPHTDFGCLSLLAQRSSGLRVKTKNGEWLDVNPIPETFVVNVGDLLSRWTNGRFRSVPHYVVNEGNSARYSVVVFIDPNSQTVIDPILGADETPLFEPISCDAYITGRFNRSFAYRH